MVRTDPSTPRRENRPKSRRLKRAMVLGVLEPRERGPVGSRSLHGSRCGGIVVPVEAHEPTEAAVWLDAMAQSLRAGAADGASAGRNA